MRVYAASLALLTWAALILQFVLSMARSLAHGLGLTDALIRFFGFFTILSNLGVALALSLPLLAGASRAGRFFARPRVNGGIAVSIIVTGAGYNLLLRGVWHAHGLQWLATELLHDVVPVLFVAYWWRWLPRGDFGARELASWTLYPLLYFAWVLAHGAATGYYPYPFLNVDRLGYARVLAMATAILIGFEVVALLILALDRRKPRNVPDLGHPL